MENKEESEVLKKRFEENKKINKEFYDLFKKVSPKGFDKMKEVLGKNRYDTLNIISGTLLSDAVILMKKIGVLEEFLENKDEISHMLINSVLGKRLRPKKIKEKNMLKNEKPKDCFECVFFGEDGEHLIGGRAHFPSLCEKDLLWFKCGGKYGLKKVVD